MFPDMYFQYNHPTSKSQQKPFDKNRQYPITTSIHHIADSASHLTAPMPHSPHNASSAAPMPHHLPANHKETQPLQPSSAALMAHPTSGKPPRPHTPQKTERTDCQRDGCMVGPRCVGVSRWSYLAPGASDGKVLCGHKPQSKPHLSEPGTHQRTWRVMGRPARQKTQTLSMTRRNDRTRHDHAAAPLADCPFVPPSIHPSHPHKKRAPRSKHPGTLPKLKYPIIINRYQLLPVVTNHHPTRSRNF